MLLVYVHILGRQLITQLDIREGENKAEPAVKGVTDSLEDTSSK